ncbi:hypothetical protein [Aquabacterium humicola]|uniref:hypothetical protein n=1 Tax=Aquabacterium humicola TaxID=3237377 RepID=UPI0025438BC1|nr:hypothetical protein [Rubrivivax pictus]
MALLGACAASISSGVSTVDTLELEVSRSDEACQRDLFNLPNAVREADAPLARHPASQTRVNAIESELSRLQGERRPLQWCQV